MFHRRVNPVSPGGLQEGLSEKAPLILKDISPKDFETFLWVFYNPYVLADTSLFSFTYTISSVKTLLYLRQHC